MDWSERLMRVLIVEQVFSEGPGTIADYLTNW